VSAGRFWFVGDIHGRADLLATLLDAVAREERAPKVVFLGDIVDRGPASRDCLDLVQETLSSCPGSRLILGNHDDMFLSAMHGGLDSRDARHWRDRSGGKETLESYGCPQGIVEAARMIKASHPAHLKMLEDAALLLRFGPFVACHAGIDPRLPLDTQHKLDVLWIRNEFLDFSDNRLVPVIHGHSITDNEMPVMTENRISLDTGAFYSGRLTCLRLDLAERSIDFFQARTEGFVEVDPEIHDRGRGTLMDRLDDLFEATPTNSQRI
jgi:serine/threonine protein phosphatase 1